MLRLYARAQRHRYCFFNALTALPVTIIFRLYLRLSFDGPTAPPAYRDANIALHARRARRRGRMRARRTPRLRLSSPVSANIVICAHFSGPGRPPIDMFFLMRAADAAVEELRLGHAFIQLRHFHA